MTPAPVPFPGAGFPESWRNPQWLRRQLKAAQAHGQGVRVGIIDTGLDRATLEQRQKQRNLPLAPIQGAQFLPKQTHPLPYEGQASAPHGTTVADVVLHLAPKVELYSADVFGPTGAAEAETLVAALRHCLDHWHCHVINMSLGIVEAKLTPVYRRQLLLRAIEDCYHRGVIVVAAAHNDHPETKSYPAVYSPPLISVERKLGLQEDEVCYVAHDQIEFAAAGRGYLGPFCTELANSWATPHVTGLVACLLSWMPDLQPFEVKTLLYWLAGGHPSQAT